VSHLQPSVLSAMAKSKLKTGDTQVIQRADLQAFFDILSEAGYQIVGPTLREQAIVYDELQSAAELPVGWIEEKSGGVYRLKQENGEALFGFTLGAHSWKKFLFPPEQRLFKTRMEDNGIRFVEDEEPSCKFAFFGMRSCELNALTIQDKIFLQGEHVDPIYKARRENCFIIAVNCARAGDTCFCVSMNTGPQAEKGFDLVMTEILESGKHYFVVEAGTLRGAEILGKIPGKKASDPEKVKVTDIVANTTQQMGRTLDTTEIQSLFYDNVEHPVWEDLGKRCLACANCTMVCPTCFCSTVEDVTDLTGEHAERWRRWDSCFTMDFTYMNHGNIRSSVKSRYRQWITHKLASWIDQFGTSGCVGCGSCITWCPVGIDITEEAKKIRETPGRGNTHIAKREK